MKLDTDYIKEILSKMEEAPTPTVYNADLMNALNIPNDDEAQEGKFIKHIYDLRDMGAIDANVYHMGFKQAPSGIWLQSDAFYRLTISGQQLLDVMKNDNWWTRVKSGGKEVSLAMLKQAPSLIMSSIISKF